MSGLQCGRCRLGGHWPALVLVFFLNFASCAAAQQSSDAEFYQGLKKRQEGAQSEAVACFEKALDSANAPIAAAAAAELLSLRAAGAEFSATALADIRQKAALAKTGGSWARALDALGAADKEQFLSLLLTGDSRALDEAALYALEKWRFGAEGADTGADAGANALAEGADISLTETEAAAISSRAAVSRSRYSEALLFFRIALRDPPDLFFRYPDLLTDLEGLINTRRAERE